MFKPLVIGSRMELVPKKSLRNNEERIVYASQILDFNDDSIVCAMPIYEGRIVPLEAGKRFDAYFYVGTKIFRACLLYTSSLYRLLTLPATPE